VDARRSGVAKICLALSDPVRRDMRGHAAFLVRKKPSDRKVGSRRGWMPAKWIGRKSANWCEAAIV